MLISNCDKTQIVTKLKLGQKSKTQNVTKLKVWLNFNWDKNEKKLKLWQNPKTQVLTKLKISICDETLEITNLSS